MKFGVYLPNFGEEATPQAFAGLAAEAENSGWDGFFLWDHILYSKSQKINMLDPWITLAAVAGGTSFIRFGPTVTPLARRRPAKLARETASLDVLSDGRLVLGAGLGDPPDADFSYFGDEADPKVRAEQLDEGLQVLDGLWSGRRYTFKGKHHKVEGARFLPRSVQRPRVPVWIGGFLPNKKPILRAAGWDGMLPLKRRGWIEPSDVEAIVELVFTERDPEALFDISIIGTRKSLSRSHGDKLARLEQAGATWWLDSLYSKRNSIAGLREMIRQGPP